METEKTGLILGNNWSDCLLLSRRILNPGKPYFVNLTVKLKLKRMPWSIMMEFHQLKKLSYEAASH